MAIFGFGKKSDQDTKSGFTADTDKAASFLARAQELAGRFQYEYALSMYANALKADPSNMMFFDGMYECAKSYAGENPKPASRDELKLIEGPTPADRVAVATLAWMRDLNSQDRVLALTDALLAADLAEIVQWVAPKATNIVLFANDKKPNKKVILKAMETLRTAGAFTDALRLLKRAQEVDPSDGALAAQFKELLAGHTIEAGGFSEAAKGGGAFKSVLKDADKQREIEMRDSISGAGGSDEFNLQNAEENYKADPMSAEVIQRLTQLLRRRGTPEAEARAIEVLLAGFKALNEYRFRMIAGDIRMGQFRRRITQLEPHAEKGNAQAVEELEARRAQLRTMEVKEFRERAEQYPTDRNIRFELGRLEYEGSNIDSAMQAFQQCKDDVRLRLRSAHMLGKCFAVEGWHNDAIGEFKEAILAIDPTQADRELDIRYDMMLSLMQLARSERNESHAKDAQEIASTILRKDISYRDIRVRRKEIAELIKELSVR
ncbi:MAG: hypothetical protein O2800_04300 [Planctomycetota bacterium]|nr:hypothetical protein [Planctomycetota bacterium]